VQVVPGGDVLACVGVQKLKAGFGLLARAASVDDGESQATILDGMTHMRLWYKLYTIIS
jgi:hypothetical protein